MNTRYELQTALETLLGSRNVYFQPPANVSMKYPAIVYELSDIPASHADNIPYLISASFKITLIDKDPDSQYMYALMKLPNCRFNSFYRSDDLNHFAFTISLETFKKSGNN